MRESCEIGKGCEIGGIWWNLGFRSATFEPILAWRTVLLPVPFATAALSERVDHASDLQTPQHTLCRALRQSDLIA